MEVLSPIAFVMGDAEVIGVNHFSDGTHSFSWE